jgi:hypothetical protein
MKKLLFILLLFPLFSFGQQGGITINQIQPNFQTGGVWHPMATAMTPDLVADASNIQEPCVLYEGSPQVITDATGSVYKMLFTAGGSTQNIMYAESVDGNDWVRRSTICIANHARTSLLKVGSTYYCYCVPTSGFGQVDVYTSTDMINWTLAAAAIITKGSAGTWNGSSVANMALYYDGTTYHMLLSGTNGGTAPFTTGYYHSTSPTSGWTAYASNPVLGVMNGNAMQASYLTKVGSTYYCWAFGNSVNNFLPSDIYTYESTNLTTWTAHNSGNPTFPRSQSDEGVGRSAGQVANPFLVEVSGKTHMFYEAGGDGSGSGAGAHIKHAIANLTIANLALTTEGNGSALTPEQVVNSYTKTASDLNYIPNATNVGANATWTPGSILLGVDPANDYGIRLRNSTTTTTFSFLDYSNLAFYASGGVNNNFAGNSTGITLNAWNNINFKNVSGSGTTSLGNFDNTGLLTTTNGVNTKGGGFFFSPTSAYGASVNPAVNLQNSSAATSGTVSRYSPAIYQVGSAWTGSASQQAQFYSILEPVSGTNPITYNYLWRHNINSGGDADVMKLNSNGTLYPSHLGSLTSAPTIAAGTGAGTSPTVSIAGNDIAQKVTITTGSSPTASATVATITFNVAYTTAPRVILTPANANAAGLSGASQVYVDDSSIGTTSYVISVGSGGLTASTTYLFYAHVIQ